MTVPHKENSDIRKPVYVVFALAWFILPWCIPAIRNYSSGAAVVCGLLFAVMVGNPLIDLTGKLTSPLLGTAIVLMGFGLDIRQVLQMGGQGIGYTLAGILIAFAAGIILGRKLQLERDTSLLICSGTAICGGSAIAAVAPALRSQPHQIAIATSIVFVLNAVALLIFPAIGHAFGFSQEQFGLWSAVAIHDTSSVVGATLQYGDRALAVGTTVKLARALWIVPLALVISLSVARKNDNQSRVRINIPWFIPGFILAAAVVEWIPSLKEAGNAIGGMSKYLMVATLFVIGSNVSMEKLRQSGWRPALHGIALWLILLVLWFIVIRMDWIKVT